MVMQKHSLWGSAGNTEAHNSSHGWNPTEGFTTHITKAEPDTEKLNSSWELLVQFPLSFDTVSSSYFIGTKISAALNNTGLLLRLVHAVLWRHWLGGGCGEEEMFSAHTQCLRFWWERSVLIMTLSEKSNSCFLWRVVSLLYNKDNAWPWSLLRVEGQKNFNANTFSYLNLGKSSIIKVHDNLECLFKH